MAVETVFVVDACAVIALLDGEAGADLVEELLQSDDHRCTIHVINVCEVNYHVYRSAGETRANWLSRCKRAERS